MAAAAKILMMTNTTTNSVKVNPLLEFLFIAFLPGLTVLHGSYGKTRSIESLSCANDSAI